MEWRMENERRPTRGRRSVGMIGDLREGSSYETLKRTAQDRAGWLEELDTMDLPDGRALLID